MVPVQLTLKGLYSYAKSVTIDFQPLVNAGLFGIFGPVGSGKSAILEALMFVLFDRTARLNKAGDDRYYNMMNLQSNEMVIDFIFKAGRNNNTKYRFYFKARRSAKDFGKVDVKDRSYYYWSKSDWCPLESPDVLGMSYENFMQTVVIPQGKFREFIDHKPKDRTQMLKELFHLDRFDIAPKAFRLLGDLKEQHKFIDGQLSQYLEIGRIQLKQLEREIESLEKEIEAKTSTEKELASKLGELQLLQHQHLELKEASEALTVLESEATFFKNKQSQLNRYLKVQTLFRDKISQQQQLLLKAKTKEQELGQLISTVESLEKEVSACRKNWDEAQKAFANREQLQHQLSDLELLLRLKDQIRQNQITTLATEKTAKELKLLDEKIESIDLQVIDSQVAAVQHTKEIRALQELLALRDWWNNLSEKQHQVKAIKNEQSSLRKEIASLEHRKKLLVKKFENQDNLTKQILKARQDIQELQLQQDWATHAKHLTEGQPCPLCGAISHPLPLTSDDLSSNLNKTQRRLDELEAGLEKQRELHQQADIIAVQIQEKSDGYSTRQKQLMHLEAEVTRHKQQYPAKKLPDRKPPNLLQNISKTENRVSQAAQESSLLDERQEQRQRLLKQRQQRKELLDKSALEKEKSQGKIDELTGMIKALNVKDLLKKSITELGNLTDQLERRIRISERNYKQSLEKLNRIEKHYNHQKGLLQSAEVQVNEIKTQNISLESEMTALCKKHGLKGPIEVQNILGLNLNIDQEQAELERYRADLHSMRSRQKLLLQKMGKKRYQESKHLELGKEHDSLKASLNGLRHQLSSKQHLQHQYQAQLKKKESLAKELQRLTVRKGHVQEISNLLRGNGFINFISSVYLQNLCKAANVRFLKLTRNRLSLELGEHNEFLVRDHLNDGKTRLLKTLSGGQIFQASLSLALSLAENVKKLNQAEQSFFFLDEGFGSLDKASLQLVFETLKALKSEGRIVGIISHVEELQMEIDLYLRVRQDPERGSVISRNWDDKD